MMPFYIQEPAENKKFQVILIDDAISTGVFVKNILKQSNCIGFIGQAECGIAGMNMIKQHQPGLVIIDLHIPGTSGFDILSWVKEKQPGVKVIMISNSIKAEYKLISESLGADYFLDKQTELSKIEGIIQSITSYYNN